MEMEKNKIEEIKSQIIDKIYGKDNVLMEDLYSQINSSEFEIDAAILLPTVGPGYNFKRWESEINA